MLEPAHRVGPRREGKPRPIVARFLRYSDREAVIRNGRKLRGTNIFVNEDLCAASQAIKSSQFPLLKQARAQGKIAFFRHTKLIIRERNEDNSAGQRPLPMNEEGAVGGAVGDSRDRAGSATEGAVTGTQVAGAWSGGIGRVEALPCPSAGRPSGSHSQSPAAPTASSQRNPAKRTMRSSIKK